MLTDVVLKLRTSCKSVIFFLSIRRIAQNLKRQFIFVLIWLVILILQKSCVWETQVNSDLTKNNPWTTIIYLSIHSVHLKVYRTLGLQREIYQGTKFKLGADKLQILNCQIESYLWMWRPLPEWSSSRSRAESRRRNTRISSFCLFQ